MSKNKITMKINVELDFDKIQIASIENDYVVAHIPHKTTINKPSIIDKKKNG